MQCIKPNPITVKGERFHVPCGKCNFCLQNRRNEWAFRLHQQYKKSNSAEFLTLTYETENLPIVKEKWTNIPFMNLEKKHLITFHRSIRKANSRTLAKIKKRNRLTSKQYAALKHKWQIKYYSVGEYGTKHHRPFYLSSMDVH